jgi:hypothetical protein
MSQLSFYKRETLALKPELRRKLIPDRRRNWRALLQVFRPSENNGGCNH